MKAINVKEIPFFADQPSYRLGTRAMKRRRYPPERCALF
jgi:hypothetical protein